MVTNHPDGGIERSDGCYEVQEQPWEQDLLLCRALRNRLCAVEVWLPGSGAIPFIQQQWIDMALLGILHLCLPEADIKTISSENRNDSQVKTIRFFTNRAARQTMFIRDELCNLCRIHINVAQENGVWFQWPMPETGTGINHPANMDQYKQDDLLTYSQCKAKVGSANSRDAPLKCICCGRTQGAEQILWNCRLCRRIVCNRCFDFKSFQNSIIQLHPVCRRCQPQNGQHVEHTRNIIESSSSLSSSSRSSFWLSL